MPIHVPEGFLLAGVHCGIKEDPQLEDLTLVTCPQVAVAAGVYTQNLFAAAPVLLDRQRTPTDQFRAVVVNSGNANACTGQRGDDDARAMTRSAAQAVGAAQEQALVMSTGIIGEYLPMDKVQAGIRQAAQQLDSDEDAFLAAARGIMTTDNGPKVASRELNVAGQDLRLAGMAKGAGMIGPKMATMLALVLTDATLTPAAAQDSLAAAVEESFNCISVEGHMSTNDSVLLLASGARGGPPLTGHDLHTFADAVQQLCVDLARQIPDDGEGASHLIAISVEGCRTRQEARQIAQTIAHSALVKTAVSGADPNWGRIVSAVGYAGVPLDPLGLELSINGTLIYQHGAPVPFDAAATSASIRQQRETQIALKLAEGDASLRFWTSDLTVEYVKFNADYRT